MKKLTSVLVGLVVVAMALVAPTAANAATPEAVAISASSAAPDSVMAPMTGNYDYVCVLQDGSSYTMASGEKITNCHGSYLQKYLDGRKLATYNLSYGGGAALNPVPSGGCVLALASGVLLILYPPTGAVAWALSGGFYVAGVAVSCTA